MDQSGDSGSGASPDDFNGRAAVIGGTVAHNLQDRLPTVPFRATVRYEFAAENRLEGTFGDRILSFPRGAKEFMIAT